MTLDYLRFTGPRRGAGRAGRGLREGAGPVPHGRDARRRLLGHARAGSRRRSSRAWPGRAGRRIACRSTRAKTSFAGRAAATCRRASRSRRRSAWRGAASARGGRGRHDAARTRVGRHRGDHELHEHVESERDDRAPACVAKKAVERGPDAQAVGEDQPRARLEGRDRLSGEGRPAAVSRRARLQPRRLRLHDVHRQQRSAARRDRRRGARARPGRLLGAVRQSQLRRAAFSRTCAPTTWRRRRSSWPTRWPARSTSI